jgi:hypothetical protein
MLDRDLLHGSLLQPDVESLSFHVHLCDLRLRFIPKCRVGKGYRAVSRNGKVLLVSRRSLDELTGRDVCVRFQTWQRSILPGEPAAPFGILMCVFPADEGAVVSHVARLCAVSEQVAELVLEVGGGQILEFRPMCAH